jgi:hypothetical protein
MKWILHACPVCSGDLHEDLNDEGWLTCFMCARSFPAAEMHGRQPVNGAARKEELELARSVKEMPYGPPLAEPQRRAA